MINCQHLLNNVSKHNIITISRAAFDKWPRLSKGHVEVFKSLNYIHAGRTIGLAGGRFRINVATKMAQNVSKGLVLSKNTFKYFLIYLGRQGTIHFSFFLFEFCKT